MALSSAWMRSLSRRIADALPFRGRSRLSDRESIVGLLSSLSAEQSRVSVQVAGRDVVYTSRLLESGEAGADLWLDTLSPTDAAIIRVRSMLSISTPREDNVLSFRSPVLEISRRAGIPCYRLGLPRHIEQRPRREDPRVVMPAERSVPVYLLDSAAKLWKGVLQDISLGGLAVRVAASGDRVLSQGEKVPSCTVRLDGASAIQTGLQICHVRVDGEGGFHVFGGRFLTLPEAHRRALVQFISRFE